jgi:acetyltransferase
VIEAHDVDEAADFALCLLSGRRARGRNVAVMGGSGGSAVVFCDTADEVGLTLAPPSPTTMQALRENLPNVASLENPIDYAAGYPRPGDEPRLRRALDAVLADPGIDQLGMLYATVLGSTLELGARVLGEAVAAADKPVLAFSVMPHALAPAGHDLLAAAGVPVLPSPARVARAMGMLATYAEALAGRDRTDEMPVLAEVPSHDLPPGAVTLAEHEAKRLAALFGIPVTRDVLLEPGRLTEPVVGLRFPLAVKIASRDIAHKTDIGAVRLDIRDSTGLAHAAAEVLAHARSARPEAHIAGVLVSEMVEDALEVIVGVVNDAAFGPVVALGLGGVLAESLRDVTYRVAPFGLDTARAMIGELRGARLFEGVRGKPARDVEALAQTLARVSALAWVLRDRVAEIDLNPVMVRSRGEGVVAADALVVLR